MNWFKIIDKKQGFKAHACNEFIAGQLVTDLEGRADGGFFFELHPEYSRFEDKLHFELGGTGMYATNQPRTTYDIGGGLQLQIDDAQAHDWILNLKQAEERVLGDGTKYIKLYSAYSCLVLTVEERNSLQSQLADDMDRLNASSDKFLTDFEASWQKAKEEYKAKHGEDLPIIRAQDMIPKGKN